MIGDWYSITIESLANVWDTILSFLPNLIGAIIVFLVGWLIAVWVGKLVALILKKIKLDVLFERTGWPEALEKAEIKISISDFIGQICKWILVVTFLLASVEILGFIQFADVLERVVGWLPNLIVAVAIFIIAVIFADILEKIIKAGAKKIEISYVSILGDIVKWAIYVFAGLAILTQLGVATAIVEALIFGLVATLSLAFGLAFGLGGKEAAAKLIEDLRKKLSEK
jgi:hypothetical protein